MTTHEMLARVVVDGPYGPDITKRMVDYWVRGGAFAPEVEATGSGHWRYWTCEQAAVAAVFVRLVRLGATMPILKATRDALAERPYLWNGAILVSPEGAVSIFGAMADLPSAGSWLVNAKACWSHVTRPMA